MLITWCAQVRVHEVIWTVSTFLPQLWAEGTSLSAGFATMYVLVGDEVRVKSNAYDGDTGVMHNGRRGKVVAVRYGDIIFKSNDNKEPVLDGTHYTPYQLQKRVR